MVWLMVIHTSTQLLDVEPGSTEIGARSPPRPTQPGHPFMVGTDESAAGDGHGHRQRKKRRVMRISGRRQILPPISRVCCHTDLDLVD